MSTALDKIFQRVAAEESKTPLPPKAPQKATSPAQEPAADPVAGQCQLRELPIAALTDFPHHPFKAYTAEKMESLQESISRHGVIVRLLVRPLEDGVYQIVAGHNRRTAARAAGYVTVPCEVRTLTDDEAQVQMIETNLQQREKLLPSEKAWAYRLYLEAENRQGLRTDLTPGQNGQKSRDTLAAASDDSSRQIQRFVRLTYLLPSLLECVDVGRLGLMAGETLSYLTEENQSTVYHFFFVDHPMYFSEAMANTLREAGGQSITEAFLQAMITAPPGMKALRRISLPVKPLRKFFVPEATPEYIAETIEKALVAYFKPLKP